MNKLIFPYKFPLSSKNLPATIISLENWSLVTVTGPDSFNFLQGQLTFDVFSIDKNKHVICAHCNAYGKVLSNLRLFRYNDGFAYIIRNSIKQNQVNELKKYSIFSKVNINYENNFVLLGIAGNGIKKILFDLMDLPNEKCPLLKKEKNFYLLWISIPIERFIIITTLEKAKFFLKKLQNAMQQNNNSQWIALEIESGFPIIEKDNSGIFTPQSMNLKELNAINFLKGCYVGQEVITKINFKKLNNQSMYWLIGYAKKPIKVGNKLEVKINKKWVLIGTILSFVEFDNKIIWVQAILKRKLLTKNNIIRIEQDVDSFFKINFFSYQLKL